MMQRERQFETYHHSHLTYGQKCLYDCAHNRVIFMRQHLRPDGRLSQRARAGLGVGNNGSDVGEGSSNLIRVILL